MNRLFGVTMQEKGISQLVSVDLQASTLRRLRCIAPRVLVPYYENIQSGFGDVMTSSDGGHRSWRRPRPKTCVFRV